VTSARVEVAVVGRVGVDFPPDAPNVALEDVRSFRRAPGGFGGNVATALGRLGVRAAVVATVGDDGHGRFARGALAGEGVDVSLLGAERGLATPLAFYEAWPPDRFPVTFYPSPAYWALTPEQLDVPAVRDARLLLVSATTLAHEPSRSLVLAAMAARETGIVLDLDWRPTLWVDPTAAGPLVREAIDRAEVVVGGAAEFAAAGIEPDETVRLGRRVHLKLGEAGARYLAPGAAPVSIAPIPVETVCGIGSGDAFVAAIVEGLLRGRDAVEAARRGNAAGAVVATRLECSAAMPRPDEVEALLRAEAAV
jgi:5-dehydro-2-deoxygluconokinase